MNSTNKSTKTAHKTGTKKVHLAHAVQYLERWAASREQVEFVSWHAGYTTIHLGVVIVNEATNGMKEFELVSKSGMRILLDPSSWKHVRTRKYPVDTVQVALRVGIAGGFLLHPPYYPLLPDDQIRNAEAQLLRWIKTHTEVVVNFGLGFYSFFFCSTVVELGPNQFGFRDPQSGGLCTVVPRLCDRVDIEESGAHSIMRMVDKKTEAWFEVTDCVSRPKDVLSGFPMISKTQQ
jgi:hypothetical protein